MKNMEELEKLHKRNIDIQDQRRLEEERNRLASQKQLALVPVPAFDFNPIICGVRERVSEKNH